MHFAGRIHGDCNEANILVYKLENGPRTNQSVTQYDIAAILDVGESTFSCVIFELSILICYMMIISKTVDWLNIGGHVLAGFLPVFPITALEMSILKTCICARFAQSLTYGAYQYARDPGNDYLLNCSHSGPILHKLWDTPRRICTLGGKQSWIHTKITMCVTRGLNHWTSYWIHYIIVECLGGASRAYVRSLSVMNADSPSRSDYISLSERESEDGIFTILQ